LPLKTILVHKGFITPMRAGYSVIERYGSKYMNHDGLLLGDERSSWKKKKKKKRAPRAQALRRDMKACASGA
jgi:hypothetical protein